MSTEIKSGLTEDNEGNQDSGRPEQKQPFVNFVSFCLIVFISNSRSGKTDLDRLIWFLRIHNHGLGRLHIHELLLDLFHALQGKFLGFFGANHEWTRINTNWEQRRKPRIARMTRIEKSPAHSIDRPNYQARNCPARVASTKQKIYSPSVISV
jgi:hypothetical protein